MGREELDDGAGLAVELDGAGLLDGDGLGAGVELVDGAGLDVGVELTVGERLGVADRGWCR